VREQILARFAGERKLFVFTNEKLRDYVLNITGQWFGLTYIQVGVAILVAVLGIVNTMTVSISDRRRELGVLQAVGGLRNQVRSTVWLEAIAVGMISLICGCALGALTLFFSIVLAVPDMAGLRLPFQYPVELAAVLVPLILAAAFLSSVGPAETAVRRSLVEALEYE
jgi:putative ABC transport system permease protein